MIVDVNKATEKLLGYSKNELIGKKLFDLDLISSENLKKALRFVKKNTIGKYFGPDELKVKRKDGEEILVEIRYLPVKIDDDIFVFGTAVDITKRKQNEATIKRMAYFDSLTNLPNRVLFKDRLAQALAYAQRSKEMLAVLLLDVDDFKVVNDTFGHSAGDLLLREIGERLSSCVRKIDTVARIGGDEFAIILPQVNHVEDASKIAQKVLKAFNAPFKFDNHEVISTTSIGISVYPFDGTDIEGLVSNADTAMYKAKELGKNKFKLYVSSMQHKGLPTDRSLYSALKDEELQLFFQPQVDIKNGEVVGIEALIRWKQPFTDVVSASKIIKLAELSGQMLPIGEWILRTACLQGKAWQDAGLVPMSVAVNFSSNELKQPDLVNMVSNVLTETKLEPGYLEIEIAENTIMENSEVAVQIFEKLKELGISIAIDDFGTGFSSAGYLKRLPVDKIKIDRSFISNCTKSSNDASIVRSIISMAHVLDMKVVAEGVETEEQLEFLRSEGCDEIQGYLYSEPKPADEVRLAVDTKLA